MTSAFGIITNTTDTDLTLVSVTTPASKEVELHQTSPDGSGGMSMEEKEGGFPIPAGDELVLDPGGDRSEEHTSELQSRGHLVCRLLLEKKKRTIIRAYNRP